MTMAFLAVSQSTDKFVYAVYLDRYLHAESVQNVHENQDKFTHKTIQSKQYDDQAAQPVY